MRPCGATRPRSGVSIPRTHASCTWNERWMRPWQGETVGHTGEAAKKVSVIFFTCIFMQYVMPFYLVLHNEFYRIERLLKSENRVFRCALRIV